MTKRMAHAVFVALIAVEVALAALIVMLAGCGAGLEDPDPRPALDASPACPNPTASKDPSKTDECKPAPKEG